VTGDRRAEVAAGLARVEQRIASACAAAGRDRSEVTLVVVTKFFPPSDVRLLDDLGVRHVGENRHQEAAAKRQECGDRPLTWHYIGHLQTNKAAAVGEWADVVQSVDRAKLLPGLSKAAHLRDRSVDVLLQVSLDPAPGCSGRSGASPADVSALAAEIAAAEGLRLRGVMGVAPLGGDPERAFGLLASAADAVRRVDPAATWLSAGMSADLEAAIEHGATHVRVGSAVLGNRPGHR
jgi:pyridoxal phosphate enzyme (YggS family)